MSEEELRRNSLSLSEVARKVRRASVNLTFGELRTDAGGVVLQVIGKKTTGKEFESIPLTTRVDGTIIRLGDVAEIRDGLVDEQIVSEVDGKPTLFVRVEATQEQSIVDVADNVTEWLANYKPPAGVEVDIWGDRVKPIFDRFSEILSNALIGIVLVFVCLVLVFDLRIATWITVGIPLSFVASLMFFENRGPDPQYGNAVCVLLADRHRGRRRSRGRREHCGPKEIRARPLGKRRSLEPRLLWGRSP